MRIRIIILLLFLPLILIAQEASVRIITQSSWPPGKAVPVTIEITRGEAQEFARFYHSLPKGFTVQNVNGAGADYFWDNDQVNFVWTDLPESGIIRIQYLVTVDKMLAGSFNLSAKFDYVLNRSKRISVQTQTLTILLDKDAGVEAVDIDLVSNEEYITLEETETEVQPEQEMISSIDFRIQVSISSQKFTQQELEERIHCELKHGVTVLKTGSMYKYQSGSFKEYDEAAEYLKELKVGGVKDAFVVAFKDNVQISIKEAEKLLKN